MSGQRWVSVWATGWVSLAIGWAAQIFHGVSAPSSLFVLTYVSPLLWLVAFFMFRKWERENKAALKPDYGEEREGVWPPPPNVPK